MAEIRKRKNKARLLLREAMSLSGNLIDSNCGNSEGTPCDDRRPSYVCKGHKWMKKARTFIREGRGNCWAEEYFNNARMLLKAELHTVVGDKNAYLFERCVGILAGKMADDMARVKAASKGPSRCPSCGSFEKQMRGCMVANCGEHHLEPTAFSNTHVKVVCSDSWHTAARPSEPSAEPDDHVHYAACNASRREPVGVPGCICVVVNKHELASSTSAAVKENVPKCHNCDHAVSIHQEKGYGGCATRYINLENPADYTWCECGLTPTQAAMTVEAAAMRDDKEK